MSVSTDFHGVTRIKCDFRQPTPSTRYLTLEVYSYNSPESNEITLFAKDDRTADLLHNIFLATKAALEAQPRRHRLDRGQCRTCDEKGDGIMPSHDASSRCESGGHSHCTCDTCF